MIVYDSCKYFQAKGEGAYCSKFKRFFRNGYDARAFANKNKCSSEEKK